MGHYGDHYDDRARAGRLEPEARFGDGGPDVVQVSPVRASSDAKLDLLLASMAQLVEVVGTLAQQVAHADPGAGAADGADDLDPGVNFTLSREDPYEPLVPMDDDNIVRRTRLAAELGIMGTPAGAAMMEGGARGFYRGLERDYEKERIELPRDLARRLVEDALADGDVREANDMGADLLKIWSADDEDSFMARDGNTVDMK